MFIVITCTCVCSHASARLIARSPSCRRASSASGAWAQACQQDHRARGHWVKASTGRHLRSPSDWWLDPGVDFTVRGDCRRKCGASSNCSYLGIGGQRERGREGGQEGRREGGKERERVCNVSLPLRTSNMASCNCSYLSPVKGFTAEVRGHVSVFIPVSEATKQAASPGKHVA